MPLIKPKVVETVVESDDRLHEEFIIDVAAPGVWVTNNNHHIYL